MRRNVKVYPMLAISDRKREEHYQQRTSHPECPRCDRPYCEPGKICGVCQGEDNKECPPDKSSSTSTGTD